MPLVSVITPTYNRAGYLKQAIKSALAQTFTDFELVIVDDGSTDNTKDVVESFSDDRIRYVWQENQDFLVARNNGIAQSSGKYLAYLDSDDLWFPNALQDMVECAKRNGDAPVVMAKSARFTGDLDFSFPIEFLHDDGAENVGNMFQALKFGNRYSVIAALVDRMQVENVGSFDPEMRLNSDWDLWLRLSMECDFVNLNCVVGAYRFHDEMRTAEPEKTVQGDMNALQKHESKYTPDELKRAEMFFYASRGFGAMAKGVEQGSEWIVHAQKLANEIGDPTAVANVIRNQAPGYTKYDDEDRVRVSNIIGDIAEMLKAEEAPITKHGLQKDFWSALVYASYALEDYRATRSCVKHFAKVCGSNHVDRGSVSMSMRSLIKILTGARQGRKKFGKEIALEKAVKGED